MLVRDRVQFFSTESESDFFPFTESESESGKNVASPPSPSPSPHPYFNHNLLIQHPAGVDASAFNW